MTKKLTKVDTKVGYDFEDTVKTVLSELQTKYPMFWHRFPDSKAASKFIAPQPADFLIGSAAGVFLLEAKASEEISSLSECYKSAISPSQVGMLTKWRRSRQRSFVAFYCQIDHTVEIWDGSEVIIAISNQTKLTVENGRIFSGHADELSAQIKLLLSL